MTLRPSALALAVLLVVTAAWGGAAVARGSEGPPRTDGAARTWVVDAVDDLYGNRWSTQGAADDRDASTTTVSVGDTVEWRFDRAAQEHDLTSRDTSSAWAQPLEEYRVPGGAPVRRTFTEPGVYDYVCSIHGVTMSGTIVVEAVGTAPTLDASVTPLAGPAPLVVHLTAGASDPDGDPLTVRWETGDGRVLTTDHAMHSYERPGTYDVTLEVADDRGGVSREAFTVTVTGQAAVTASADRSSGPAPLTVRLTSSVADGHQGPGLRYRWDLGEPGAEPVTGRTVAHTYDDPGTYTAVLEVTGADGPVGTDSVDLVVGGEEPLPGVTASATPAPGTREVGFSAGVRTSGEVTPYAAGTELYPELAGTASMVRSRGATETTLQVRGLKSGVPHLAHVHEQPCGTEDGGAHFRFDETKPFEESNEIWPYFTSTADGRSGRVVETSERRAGPRAVSVVVHDPDNPARRIGCADLDPDTAGLSYRWDLGDGTTSREADPTHVYARPGTYTARLTVSRPDDEGHTGDHQSVTSTVQVQVGPRVTVLSGPGRSTRSRTATFRFAGAEAGTFSCRLDTGPWRACSSGVRYASLRDGAHRFAVRTSDPDTDSSPATRTWTVDTTGPAVGSVAPTGRTAARRPTVRAHLTDRWSAVRPGSVTLRLDGRVVRGVRYDTDTHRLRWRPTKKLAVGQHRVHLTAADTLGNRSSRRWTFRVTR